MITNGVLIQVEIEIEEGVAHIRCPYCLKSYNVSLSATKRSNKTWWNTSNFDRHVDLSHKDFSHFDSSETDCEYNFNVYLIKPSISIVESKQAPKITTITIDVSKVL